MNMIMIAAIVMILIMDTLILIEPVFLDGCKPFFTGTDMMMQ